MESGALDLRLMVWSHGQGGESLGLLLTEHLSIPSVFFWDGCSWFVSLGPLCQLLGGSDFCKICGFDQSNVYFILWVEDGRCCGGIPVWFPWGLVVHLWWCGRYDA
jgi:hypothetical protein